MIKHIPRPRNAFIIFRASEAKIAKESGSQDSQQDISKHAGHRWKVMTKMERKPYIKAAEQEKLEHAQKYPNYKYQPKKRDRPSSATMESKESHHGKVHCQKRGASKVGENRARDESAFLSGSQTMANNKTCSRETIGSTSTVPPVNISTYSSHGMATEVFSQGLTDNNNCFRALIPKDNPSILINSKGDSTVPLPQVSACKEVSHQTELNINYLREDDYEEPSLGVEQMEEFLSPNSLKHFDIENFDIEKLPWLLLQEGENVID